jgi:nitrogen fixation protein FixH
MTRRTRARIEPWPLAVAGMLVAMAAVLGLFLQVAIAHRDAAVVEDAYAAGLRLSSEIDAARRARERGVDLALVAAREGGGVRVRVSVTSRDGAAVAESVSVRRERAAEGGLDETFALARDGGDGFVGFVPLPRPGRWELEARAQLADTSVARRFGVEASP